MPTSLIVNTPPLVLGTADCDCTIPFSHIIAPFIQGVRGSPRQAAIGGLPPVGGLPFAMLAKSEDLTFTNPTNVIFSHFVDMLLVLSAKEKMCCDAPCTTLTNRRVLPSDALSGMFALSQIETVVNRVPQDL